MPSNDDLLFAEHAVRGGFVGQAEIDESLSVQRRMEEMGVRDSLRNVLVKRGVLREGDAALIARAAGLRSGRAPIPGYTLEARLGTGAMGSVYRAWQTGMKRHVAIKILRRDLTDDPRQVERLQREAQLIGKLDHPNIVRGLDGGESEGLVWFVMEYVEGETLRERIRRAGPLSADEAVTTTRLLAEALVHANSQNVVHRDIKPGNVLLTKDGVPRLSDYGLAKGESDDALTQVDATLGTPQYIAPEQARNPRDADIRSDIYSLGATLYTMLTGRPPFEGESLAATLTKVLYERPAPVETLAPETPPALVYVLQRMMAKDRRYRYADPAELVRDLRSLEQGRLQVPHGFRGDIEAFEERRRHHRMWLAGAAVVLVSAGLAVAGLWWEERTAEEQRRAAAAARLEDVRGGAGPRERWDERTVERMLRDLRELRTIYAGTPAAELAREDLDRWQRQERELRRVQDLAARADRTQGEWPRLIAEFEQALHDLRRREDASAAAARLARQLEELRSARDRAARAALEAGRRESERMSLEQAAAHFDQLARRLRTEFHGPGDAEAVTSAEDLGARFARASSRLAGHFAGYRDAVVRDGGLQRHEFRRLQELLLQATEAAVSDEELRSLLASLPPENTRTGMLRDYHDEQLGALREASAARWRDVRAEAERLLMDRRHDAAIAVLDEFLAEALADEREPARELRARAERERSEVGDELRRATDAAARTFFDAVGRRDLERARDTLAELDVVAASAPARGETAAAFAAGGRRLLQLLEGLVWDRFRARLASGAPLERGLTDRRTGTGYHDVRDVRVTPLELSFAYAGGQRWVGSPYDVALVDVLHYAEVPRSTREGALALAALRLAEYRIPPDPRKGLDELQEASNLLGAGRELPGMESVVERLSRLRDRRFAETQAEISDAERTAREVHETGLASLQNGRYDVAESQLQSLIRLQRLRQTEYVATRRAELRQQIDRAARGRLTSNYAAHFPGARFVELPDGGGALRYDFDSPELETDAGRRAIGLTDGRSRIGSRLLVVADHPRAAAVADGPVELPLVLEHVFEWLAVPEEVGPPAPLELSLPFLPRQRIEVSFLYRSREPFFLAVSIAGTTAGVLSAPDNPYGGRGAILWNAESLAQPDLAFPERHRASYLDEHPQELRREADTTFFHFEPGRVYRVRFVKDARRSQLLVDEQVRAEAELGFRAGPLADRLVILSDGPGEIDDLQVTGVPDPDWLRGR